jgi:hypothetical protein
MQQTELSAQNIPAANRTVCPEHTCSKQNCLPRTYLLHAGLLLGLFTYHESKGDVLFLNIG